MEIETLVARCRLEPDVQLPGFVANPYAYMARGAVFALSSRWEGLPGADRGTVLRGADRLDGLSWRFARDPLPTGATGGWSRLATRTRWPGRWSRRFRGSLHRRLERAGGVRDGHRGRSLHRGSPGNGAWHLVVGAQEDPPAHHPRASVVCLTQRSSAFSGTRPSISMPCLGATCSGGPGRAALCGAATTNLKELVSPRAGCPGCQRRRAPSGRGCARRSRGRPWSARRGDQHGIGDSGDDVGDREGCTGDQDEDRAEERTHSSGQQDRRGQEDGGLRLLPDQGGTTPERGECRGPSNAITGTNSANSTIAATASGDSTTVTVRRPTSAEAIRKAPSSGPQRANARR